MTLRFNAKTIGIWTQVRIILPTGVNTGVEDFAELFGNKKPLPVLWLLHGGTDNYADWHDCTPVQVIADKYNYAVVMPDAQLSSYANMVYGPNWLDYFRSELPEYIYNHFPISRRREDNFISGMSMGGAGAMKLALLDPQKFCIAVPVSPGIEVLRNYAAGTGRASANTMFRDIYGHEDNPSEVLNSDEDIYWLLEKNVKAGVDLPMIKFCVGEQDFTRDGNIEFTEFAKQLGIDIEWYSKPGFHDWDSWNIYIPKVFEYISEYRKQKGWE